MVLWPSPCFDITAVLSLFRKSTLLAQQCSQSATCRMLYKPNTLAWNYPGKALLVSPPALCVSHTLSVLKTNVAISSRWC